MPERLEFELDGDARGFEQAMRQAAQASRQMNEAFRRLAGEADDAEQEVDGVGDAVKRTGAASRRASDQTTTLAGSMTKMAVSFNLVGRGMDLAARGIAGVVRGMVDANRAGVALNLQFETMGVRLRGVTGSVETAQAALGTFRQIAATTAFSVRDVSEAGTTLAAFMGTEFTKNIEGTTKAVADLAAFMGLSATEAAAAMGRAFAGGAGAADILRERGVLNLIKSFKGIDDLTKLTLPQFREALLDTMVNTAGPIAGATDRMSQTTVGAISNMGDAWEALTATLTEEAMPEIRSFALAVTGVFQEAAERVTGEAGLAQAIAKITADIRANEPTLVKALEKIAKAAGAVAKAFSFLPEIARIQATLTTGDPRHLLPLVGQVRERRRTRAAEAQRTGLRETLFPTLDYVRSLRPEPPRPFAAFVPGAEEQVAAEAAAREAGRRGLAVTVPAQRRRTTVPIPTEAVSTFGRRRALGLELAEERAAVGPRAVAPVTAFPTVPTRGITREEFQRRAEIPGTPEFAAAQRNRRVQETQIRLRQQEEQRLRERPMVGPELGPTRRGLQESVKGLKEQAKALGINVEAFDETATGIGELRDQEDQLRDAIERTTNTLKERAEETERQRRAAGRLSLAQSIAAVTNRDVGNAVLATTDAMALFGDKTASATAKAEAFAVAAEQIGAATGGMAGGILQAAARVSQAAFGAAAATGGNPYATAGAAVLQIGLEAQSAFQNARDDWEKLADSISDRFAGVAQIISTAISEGLTSREIKQAVDQFVRTLIAGIAVSKIVQATLEKDFDDLEKAVKAGEPTEDIIRRIVGKIPGLTEQAQAAVAGIEEGALAPIEPGGRFGTPRINEGALTRTVINPATGLPVAAEAERARPAGLSVTTISGGFRDVLQALGNRRDNLLAEIRDTLREMRGGMGLGDGMALAGAGGGDVTTIRVETVEVQTVADLDDLGDIIQDQFNVGMGRAFAKAKRAKGVRP